VAEGEERKTEKRSGTGRGMNQSTLRKHGLNVLDPLLDLFVGNPQVLFPQPE